MKILITGSNGLTGQKIVGQLLRARREFLATSVGGNRNPDCPAENYASLDITDVLAVKECISKYEPQVVINTAAMTNVDQCETEEENCKKINVTAVKYLHDVCKLRNIHLIHLSTDFVFDGTGGPYREEDKPNPLSVYAKSKYDAEQILTASSFLNWTILRTIIVYGHRPGLSRSNLILWAIDSLSKGQEIKIVNDQFRAPTWADDLAWACIRCTEVEKRGIFHISGPHTFSIYEIVCQIADHLRVKRALIVPIDSASLNQKAKRPPRTGFILDRAIQELGYQPKTFQETLEVLSPVK